MPDDAALLTPIPELPHEPEWADVAEALRQLGTRLGGLAALQLELAGLVGALAAVVEGLDDRP